MGSYKKLAKAGHTFMLAANPTLKYRLEPIPGSDDSYTLMQGTLKIAIAHMTYKHLHLTIHHGGLRFTKEIALSDMTFLP